MLVISDQVHLWGVVTVEAVVEPRHKGSNDEESDAAIVELCKHLSDELVLVAIHCVEDEGHTHAHDGTREKCHKDHLLLNVNLCAWPEDSSNGRILRSNCCNLVMKYTARPMKATWPSKCVQMFPVSVWIRNMDLKHSRKLKLGCRRKFKLPLSPGKGRPMPLSQVVIVLQPLWQACKGNNLVSLKLVPHVHGKDFCLVSSIVHGRPRVQPSRVHPRDIRPLELLLNGL